MKGEAFRHCDTHFGKAIWLVNIRVSTNQPGPAQSKLPCAVEGDKVPTVQMKSMSGKTGWVSPASGQGKSVCGISFAAGP